MAFSLTQFPLPTASPPTKPTTTKLSTSFKSNFTTTTVKINNHHHRFTVIRNAAEEQQQKPTTTESETTQQQQPPSDEELSELGAEIKKAMMDRDEVKKDESIWGGVAEEIGRIEWPAFNKVLGTTGVVLGVIAGSSVVLLTVNAVLAELSDRVFAGRGVQDFFG
ncbi:putative SecE superfamily protein [Helianthus anomalus]